MDISVLLAHIRTYERHIADAEAEITRQNKLIERICYAQKEANQKEEAFGNNSQRCKYSTKDLSDKSNNRLAQGYSEKTTQHAQSNYFMASVEGFTNIKIRLNWLYSDAEDEIDRNRRIIESARNEIYYLRRQMEAMAMGG